MFRKTNAVKMALQTAMSSDQSNNPLEKLSKISLLTFIPFFFFIFILFTCRPLFKKFNDYKILVERLIALDAKENEPGRLNNRGGQLLKEEKERNAINSKLPKIDSEICAMAKQFEEENKRKFLVWGEDILLVIENFYTARKTMKKEHVSARKATTAMSAQKTPLAAKLNRPQAQTSIKRVPSSTSLYVVKFFLALNFG